MNTKLKVGIIAGAAALVLVVGGLVALRLSLGAIVKAGIETIGPKVTKSKVTVDSVSFKLLKGKLSVKGFAVGNPEGFSTPEAMRVKKFSIALEPRSLLNPKIHIVSINISGVALTCEQGLTSNNLTTLKSNVNSFLSSQGEQKPAEQQKQPAKEGKKLQVDSVNISDISVKLALTGMSKEGSSVPVPGVTLSNLGSGPEGITPGELAAKILDSLLNGAIGSVTPFLNDASAALGKGADSVKEGAGKAVDSIMGVFK